MDQHGLAPEWRIAEWLNTPAPIHLAEQRGRIVVTCAFQMLCPGCVARAIPQLRAANELFAPRGVVVVGLRTVFEHHEAMTTTSLRAFLHEDRIHFPVGVDSPSDDGEPVPKTMQGTPTLPLIDRAGHLRRQTFGHVSDLELEAAVAELMAVVNQLERGFMPDRVVPRFLTTWKAVNGTADSFVDSIEVRCVDGVGVKNLRGIGRFAATVQATRPPVF